MDDLLELIRQAMKSPKQTTRQVNRTGGTTESKSQATQQSKRQPRRDEHGQLGDFSRSNSNPTSRTVNNSVSVGFEDISGAGDDSIKALIRINLAKPTNPSKRQVKRMAAPKMSNSNRAFSSGNGCGVGSSKSPLIGIIKAIAAEETGCIVREQMKDKKTKEPLPPISLTQSQKNSNTTQGNYNPMIVE